MYSSEPSSRLAVGIWQVSCSLVWQVTGASTALLVQAVRIITREAPPSETVMSETLDLRAAS